jgi:preprotein translocase subunit SecD
LLYFSCFKMTLIWVAGAIAGVLDAPSLFAGGLLTGQISGNFTALNAKDIAFTARAGPLPARLTIAEESPMAAPK